MELRRAALRLAPEIGVVPLTLTEAAERLRDGELAAEAYARQLLDRCERESELNAFISIDPSSLLRAAREADQLRRRGAPLGRLHGVPIALKDNINTQALPTSSGTAGLEGFRPGADAPAARRLFDAGALLIGKTNMHELSMGWTGANPRFGRARNPHDRARSCGGSSSGSACAVAAGLAPAALGSDTNGSLRLPASFCGIASFRPTPGRYPREGIAPLSQTLDTVGPMARRVADLIVLDAILAGAPDARLRANLAGVRIGYAPDYFLDGASPQVVEVFERALARLSDAGAKVVALRVPELERLAAGLSVTLIHFESARALPDYLEAFGATKTLVEIAAAAGPDVRETLLTRVVAGASQSVSQAVYEGALSRRRQVSSTLEQTFRAHRLDLLIYPTARVPAPLLSGRFVSPAPDYDEDGFQLGAREAFGKNVAPSALARLPSLVLPAGASRSGLPVGLEFAVPSGRDESLLSLGPALEAALDADFPPTP